MMPASSPAANVKVMCQLGICAQALRQSDLKANALLHHSWKQTVCTLFGVLNACMSCLVPCNCRGSACRCVLGDRAYSKPWGGSVLDSVIGTFLTQNVSDQLSSKAYMTLAARFPARPHILNPGLHPKHNAPSASPLPPELPCHGNADRICWASGHNADQTTFVHMGKGMANCGDLGVRERQLVVTVMTDITDAVNWEAVRIAPASQVILLHSSLPHRLLA